ncbi:hypothetical protein HDU80_006542 [Chytriomyces hyalinus]|nr:hypothetical protein HDU80_006542 [Chytriomyces hyalinus]
MSHMQHPLLTPVQGSSANAFDVDLDLDLGYFQFGDNRDGLKAAPAPAAGAKAEEPLDKAPAHQSYSVSAKPQDDSLNAFNFYPAFTPMQPSSARVHTDTPHIGNVPTSNGVDPNLDSFLMGAQTITAFPQTPLLTVSANNSASFAVPGFPAARLMNNAANATSSTNNSMGGSNLYQSSNYSKPMQQLGQFPHNHLQSSQRQNLFLPHASDILMPSPMIHRPSHNLTDEAIAYLSHPTAGGSASYLSAPPSAANSPYIMHSSARDPDHWNPFPSSSNPSSIPFEMPLSSLKPNSATANSAHSIHCPFTNTCHSSTSFPNAKALRDHVREQHQTDLVHSCPDCGRGFLDKMGLDGHLCRNAGLGSGPFTPHLGILGLSRSRRGSMVAPQSSHLSAGLNGSHGHAIQSGESGDEDDDQALELDHMKKKKGSAIVCEYEGCGKSFTLQKSYIVHVRTHTGEKPHVCTYPNCNKAFAQPSGLRSHIFTHTGERPYKCTLCPKTYTTSSRLKIHFRAHTNEEPYACEYAGCTRRFKQKSNLDQHIVTHLEPELREQLSRGNRKEVGCCECGRNYKNWASLDQHCWREHGKSAAIINKEMVDAVGGDLNLVYKQEPSFLQPQQQDLEIRSMMPASEVAHSAFDLNLGPQL